MWNCKKQLTNQNMHSIRKHLSLKEELEEEMETCSAQLSGLNASTLALDSNSRAITVLRRIRSVVFRVLATKHLRSSFAPTPSSLNPSSSSNPLPLPPPSFPPEAPSEEDLDATGKPDVIYVSQRVDGKLPHTCGLWHVCCRIQCLHGDTK